MVGHMALRENHPGHVPKTTTDPLSSSGPFYHPIFFLENLLCANSRLTKMVKI